GTSRFPWSAAGISRYIDYSALALPGSEKFLETTISMGMNPSYTDKDITDFCTAIQKVGDHYRTKNKMTV
ncbi:MAG: hypothetical protein HY326_11890, partial [Chloroflexi bacterium]|nr:hypothetical protein [Chloroflexota bacterium]